MQIAAVHEHQLHRSYSCACQVERSWSVDCCYGCAVLNANACSQHRFMLPLDEARTHQLPGQLAQVRQLRFVMRDCAASGLVAGCTPTRAIYIEFFEVPKAHVLCVVYSSNGEGTVRFLILLVHIIHILQLQSAAPGPRCTCCCDSTYMRIMS